MKGNGIFPASLRKPRKTLAGQHESGPRIEIGTLISTEQEMLITQPIRLFKYGFSLQETILNYANVHI
jgi:hypothetical protein